MTGETALGRPACWVVVSLEAGYSVAMAQALMW